MGFENMIKCKHLVTLTIKLDLDMVQANLLVKLLVRSSNGSVVRVLTDGQTHTKTDGADSITSTADAGGKNPINDVHVARSKENQSCMCVNLNT